MTNQYSGDLRTGTSSELDLLGERLENMDREIRRLKSWKEEISSGNMVRASNIQGTIPAANGGSAVVGNTLGSVDPWNNASGATQVQGTVVTENGNRTFGVTTTVDDLKVIGVLDDASIAVGVDGRVRHNGYQAVVKTQGVVTAGHYLRSSATVGRAEDSGLTGSTGSFAIALTASAGGAATVTAYVFPIGMAGALAPIGGSFLTITAEPSLPSERQIQPIGAYTKVGGVGVVDDGANVTATLTLKDLIANWVQAGVFQISHAGDLIVLKHLALGSAASLVSLIIADIEETIANKNAVGVNVSLTTTVAGTLASSKALQFLATLNATTLTTPLFGGVVGSVQHGGLGATITDMYGSRAELQSIAGTGAITRAQAYWAASAVWGAGVIPPTTHGLRVDNQGNASVTTPYGFKVAAQTGTNPRSYIADGLVLGTDAILKTLLDVYGNLGILSDNLLKLFDSDNSNFIGIRADSARTTDLTYVLPAADPAAGQVLSPSAPSGGVVTLTWVDSDTPTFATVSTTDATQTTLATITIPTSTTMLITARVAARRTGGSGGTAEDGAGYELTATVKNVAGTATLIGAVAALSTQEDQAAWDATIDVTAATARVRVTGAANNNVDWKCSTKTLSVT